MALTYDYRCDDEECGFISQHRCSYDDRLQKQQCPCGSPASWTPSAPMVMQYAWPDGHRRKNDPNWQRLRNASKLRVEKVSTSDKAEREKIQTEIDKAAGTAPKPKPKRALDMI